MPDLIECPFCNGDGATFVIYCCDLVPCEPCDGEGWISVSGAWWEEQKLALIDIKISERHRMEEEAGDAV